MLFLHGHKELAQILQLKLKTTVYEQVFKRTELYVLNFTILQNAGRHYFKMFSSQTRTLLRNENNLLTAVSL